MSARVSRRDALRSIGRGAALATGAAVAGPVGATPITPISGSLQREIDRIRSLPGSTPYGVYVALQDVADRLQRIVDLGT